MNSADPDQTPHYEMSEQGLHCFLTRCSIKVLGKMKIALRTDKGGHVHLA